VRAVTTVDGVEILSVGELTNVGVAPAVANAVAAATGVRLRELPLTPDRVLARL
jgi:xanthine dehydrogenase YagR molybdenum-binding subunit